MEAMMIEVVTVAEAGDTAVVSYFLATDAIKQIVWKEFFVSGKRSNFVVALLIFL
jgi:hypothetical protein